MHDTGCILVQCRRNRAESGTERPIRRVRRYRIERVVAVGNALQGNERVVLNHWRSWINQGYLSIRVNGEIGVGSAQRMDHGGDYTILLCPSTYDRAHHVRARKG